MNHKKFIQLLNLYIDGEATPVEAREIEREIENDPARRRIYREYCQIQTATRTLYSQFRTAADLSQVSGTSRQRGAGLRRAAARPDHASGPPFRRLLFWSSGAAAACLAVAVAFWSLPRSAAPQRPLEAAESPGVSVPTRAAAVAVADSVSVPPTYAAPLMAESRQDPYWVQAPALASDPFALRTPVLLSSPGEPEGRMVAADYLENARFMPPVDSSQFDPDRVAEQNRKLQAILRSGIARENQQPEPAPGQSPFVPVNFRSQP